MFWSLNKVFQYCLTNNFKAVVEKRVVKIEVHTLWIKFGVFLSAT